MSTYSVGGRAFVVMACAVVIGAPVLGCSDLCAEAEGCHSDTGAGGAGGTAAGGSGPGKTSCPEDPRESPVGEDCGVWVSSSFGSDEGAGTRAFPVATVARGIELAAAGKGRVYLCAEVFAEAAVVPRGVSLFGGFDCHDDWHFAPLDADASGLRTLLAPGPGAIPLFLSSLGEGDTLIQDVAVEAASAALPGESSIGVFADAGSRPTLRRCDVTAGDGADGAPGEHGGASPAAAGLAGSKGSDACSAEVGEGGPTVQITCDDGSTSTGGKGGDGTAQSAADGEGGAAEPASDPAPPKNGGYGESTDASCTDGLTGANGEAGVDGLGGQGTARLTKAGFQGVPGANGGHGRPGQGGGGGGASLGKPGACSGLPGGAGGGSGGSGGCGGRGGLGGRGGGASIGVATRSAALRLEERVTVHTGNGGRGGTGGSAQIGGKGGAAGPGGAGAAGAGGTAKAGCLGMFGGHGGDGGYGGGGMGGPSIGVAFSSESTPYLDGLILVSLGKGGDGGWGGNPSLPASEGHRGEAAEILALAP